MAKHGGKILVVDDENLVCWSLCSHLSSLGYLALSAGSCGEALEVLAREQPVPLVITDIGMPLRDGIELIRCAHALFPEVRFLVITANPEQAVIDRALQAGAIQAFGKPFDLGEIGSAVARLV
jgi:CheY-like chemotaxis protein